MDVRLLLCSALAAFACATTKQYSPFKGMQGFWITCNNEESLAFVLGFEGRQGFDFMKITRLPRDNVHVLVNSSQVPYFKNVLDHRGIKYTIFIDDFQKIVDEESQAQDIARLATRNSASEGNYTFTYYPRHEEINEYLKMLNKTHSDVSLINIGNSYEGREMYGVKISSGSRMNKPAVLIDAGIHAREWIASTTALYAISELLKESNAYLYENVDWYIFPLLNPDGYEYTHTDNRMWRKTRSPNEAGLECDGVDANRNFGYKWMEVGASSFPCSEIYAGKEAFSEVETQNLRDFVLSQNSNIQVYLTFHSYGQYILHPWGWTSDLPKNEPVLRSVAEEAEEALSALYGTRYTIGSSTNVLYAAAGGSDDWLMAVGGAQLSYTIELPGSSFVVSPKRIQSIGAETFEAIRVFGQYAEIM